MGQIFHSILVMGYERSMDPMADVPEEKMSIILRHWAWGRLPWSRSWEDGRYLTIPGPQRVRYSKSWETGRTMSQIRGMYRL